MVGMRRDSCIIFLLDDDLEDLEFLSQALQVHCSQLQLVTFTSTDSLLMKLEQLPDAGLPHMIIVDYHMPMMDGSEFIALIKSQPKYRDIAFGVYAITLPAPPHNPLHKADLYLTKGIDVTELEAHAEQFLVAMEAKYASRRL